MADLNRTIQLQLDTTNVETKLRILARYLAACADELAEADQPAQPLEPTDLELDPLANQDNG